MSHVCIVHMSQVLKNLFFVGKALSVLHFAPTATPAPEPIEDDDSDDPAGSMEFPESDAHAQAHILHRESGASGSGDVAALAPADKAVADAIALGKRLGVI